MPAKYSIGPVAKPDVAAIGEFLFESKLKLSINRLLWRDWPNEDAQRRHYTKVIENSLTDVNIDTFKVVDDTSHQIIGFMALTRVRPIAKAQNEADSVKGDTTPGLFRAEVLQAVSEAGRTFSDRMAGVDHLDLTYIYVVPSHRQRGIGSRLLREACEGARDERLRFTLATEPEGYHFFLKQGFEDTVHVDFDLAKWAAPLSGYGTFRLYGMELGA